MSENLRYALTLFCTLVVCLGVMGAQVQCPGAVDAHPSLASLQAQIDDLEREGARLRASLPTAEVLIEVVETTKGVGKIGEVQTVSFYPTPSAGTFLLIYEDEKTDPIPFDATAETVKEAMLGLSSLGVGDLEVTGLKGGPWTLSFGGSLVGIDLALVEGDPAGLAKTILIETGGSSIVIQPGGSITVTSGDAFDVSAGGDLNLAGGGDLNLQTTGHVLATVTGNLSVDADGDVSTTAGGNLTVDATGDHTTTVGGEMAVNGDMDLNVMIQQSLNARAGVNATLDGGFITTVKGSNKLLLQGGSELSATGGIINLN